MYFPDFETYITEMSLSCPYNAWTNSVRRVEWAVTVTYSEELLSSRDDMSDDKGCAQGQDDVLIVWVEDKSVNNFAYRVRKNSISKYILSN